MRYLLMAAAAALALGGVAQAAPPKKPAAAPRAAAKKLVEVTVCPIMGHPVQGRKGQTSTFGKYKVYFCCESCKPTFEKLSPAEKHKKIAVSLKKQAAAKKKKSAH